MLSLVTFAISVQTRKVERLFLAVPRGCLRFVIVVFPDQTHLLLFVCLWALANSLLLWLLWLAYVDLNKTIIN